MSDSNDIYKLKLSESELSGVYPYGNKEVKQVDASREIDNTNFSNGLIHFTFDVDSNKRVENNKCYFTAKVNLTRANGDLLQDIDGIHPAFGGLINLIKGMKVLYNGVEVESNFDYMSQIDLITKRSFMTKDYLDGIGNSLNNYNPNPEERLQYYLSNTGKELVYYPFFDIFFGENQPYLAVGRWEIIITPNTDYARDFVDTAVPKTPNVDYKVEVQSFNFYISEFETERVSDTTYYINTVRHIAHTIAYDKIIRGFHRDTFTLPKHTTKVAVFFQNVNPAEKTVNGASSFGYDYNTSLKKLYLEFKGRRYPPLTMENKYTDGGMNAVPHTDLQRMNYYKYKNHENGVNYEQGGYYLLAEFNEHLTENQVCQVIHDHTETLNNINVVVIAFVNKQFKVIVKDDAVVNVSEMY